MYERGVLRRVKGWFWSHVHATQRPRRRFHVAVNLYGSAWGRTPKRAATWEIFFVGLTRGVQHIATTHNKDDDNNKNNINNNSVPIAMALSSLAVVGVSQAFVHGQIWLVNVLGLEPITGQGESDRAHTKRWLRGGGGRRAPVISSTSLVIPSTSLVIGSSSLVIGSSSLVISSTSLVISSSLVIVSSYYSTSDY